MNSQPATLLRTPALLASLLLSFTLRAQVPDPIGQWDFNNDDLSATVGVPLDYLDGGGGQTEQGTRFGTTTSFGIPDINGQVAKVMRFSTNIPPAGYYMLYFAAANGGGGLINQWTLVLDVLYPAESDGKLRAIIETDGRAISADADFFVNAAGGIGVNGQFDGQLRSNTWYRIGFVVDASLDQIRKYVNGQLVGTQRATSGTTAALDGRWALNPTLGAELFNDNDGDTAPGFVNSIQLRDVALSSDQMQALAGPSADGIPQVIPPIPSYIIGWTPPGPIASRTADLGVVINGGETVIADSSIVLRLDGQVLADREITRNDPLITVSRVNPGPFPVGSRHVLQVSYTDSLAGPKAFSNSFSAALFLEDFEALTLGPKVDEGAPGDAVWTGTPPPGWTVDRTGVPGYEDGSTDGVTEWAGWSFAKKDWWVGAAEDQRRSEFIRGLGTVAIADPDEWDDASHPSGLYNTFLLTPAIPLTGVAPGSVFLTFDSSWRPECCDDNAGLDNSQTAVITVSYDGGSPIEVFKWDSTPNSPNFHPDAPNETVTVQMNNPAAAQSMVVSFGLTRAENDWWWAIDNVVINSGVLPPTITRQPALVSAVVGDSATLSVSATGGGTLTHQWFKGSGASKTAVPGATSSSLTFNPVAFADDGVYSVRVSNEGGSAQSDEARLVVAQPIGGRLTNDLVIHLTFDGDVDDFSGHGNHGAVMGNVEFVPGRVGQALRYSSAKDGTFFNYVTLGTPADLNFGSEQNFTIAFWTQFSTWTGDPAFVANKNWSSGGNVGYVIATGGGGGLQWNTAVPRLDYDGPDGTLADNNWHHVVVSWNRTGSVATYLDGELTALTPAGPSANFDSGLPTNIGQDGTGAYTDNGSVGIADGTIDELGIWRRALNDQEVKALFRAGFAGTDISAVELAPAATQDLVGYYGFEDNLTDGSGRNNNGTAVGTVPFVPGRLGKAINYVSRKDGTSFNYVTLGRPADFNFGTAQSFSISFWARLNAWTGDPAFLANKDWGSGSNPGWVVATESDGRIQWNIAGTPTGASGGRHDFDSGGGVFSDLAWHHIVTVFDRVSGAGAGRAYVDGRRINETLYSGPDNNSDTPTDKATNIGQDGVGSYTDGNSVGVDGVMDEVGIWRRKLTDDEVKGLHAAGITGRTILQASPLLTLLLPPSAVKATLGPDRTKLTLTWDANARVRIQRSQTLGGAWQDVPGTVGLGSYEAVVDPAQSWFYRLARP